MLKNRSNNFLFASVLGLGTAPVASGTVASLVAGVPCFLLIGHLSVFAQLLVSIFVFLIGWYVSTEVEYELGRTDPGEVVIDELCGFLVAMIGHPVSLVSIAAGFFLFRLFDIWKPWPLRFLERNLKRGLGIMMDDVGAGIYANILGLVILKLLS